VRSWSRTTRGRPRTTDRRPLAHAEKAEVNTLAQPASAHVFPFERSAPITCAGGTLHRGTQQRFPVLRGLAIQSLRLNRGAIREPHVHPNAEQLDYCVAGRARVGIVGPQGVRQLLELGPGDSSFAPQG